MIRLYLPCTILAVALLGSVAAAQESMAPKVPVVAAQPKPKHVHHGILEGAFNDARVVAKGATYPVRHPKKFFHHSKSGAKKVVKGAAKV